MCLNISAVKDVAYIPRSICNNKRAQQALQKHPIFITEADNDYILDKIILRYQIYYKKHINID